MRASRAASGEDSLLSQTFTSSDDAALPCMRYRPSDEELNGDMLNIYFSLTPCCCNMPSSSTLLSVACHVCRPKASPSIGPILEPPHICHGPWEKPALTLEEGSPARHARVSRIFLLCYARQTCLRSVPQVLAPSSSWRAAPDRCSRRKVRCMPSTSGEASGPCKNCQNVGLKCTYNAVPQVLSPSRNEVWPDILIYRF